MTASDETIAALREALRFSPENIPLHQHLAETLVKMGRLADAETAFREALAVAPDHVRLKLGLAQVFFQLGKNSQALVLVEDLLKGSDVPAGVYLLSARILARRGENERAASQYREALAGDPALADPELAAELDVRPEPARHESAYDEVDADDQGRMRLLGGESEGSPLDSEIERPRIAFDNVGGMESLKEEIRLKIIHPLQHPDLYKAYGKSIGGGILMYGPPGCGKTHLARATAGEVQAGFISVGIHDVLDMYIGNSEKRLHMIFAQARRNRPCVLFFDEVDALGASRTDMRHHAGRHLINQFLAELDGTDASNESLLILAATNAPWHLDNAFRRPGRFDRILFVPPPDEPARAAILRLLCAGKPVEALDYEQIAKKTRDFSGADLKAVVDVAIEAKLREAMKSGLQPLRTKDLLAAAGQVKPSTKEWFSTARNYALYSNQGGTYDDILKYLKL